MKNRNTLFYGLIGLSTIVIIVFGVLIMNKSETSSISKSTPTTIEIIGAKTHDWGNIDINGGNVEKTFQVKNTGDADLEVAKFKTSCMCTETKITIGDDTSPSFGMHSNSGWIGNIPPGQTADIHVVFDPMFHGPTGTGPITRLVAFQTNDPDKPTVELKLTGNVISSK